MKGERLRVKGERLRVKGERLRVKGDGGCILRIHHRAYRIMSFEL